MMRSLLLVVLEVTTAISLEAAGIAIVEVGSGPKRNGGGRVVLEVNDVIKVLK